LLLDKPTGITSNAALQRVKRLFRARKAGHTGSLDPLASGMLPICLGQATKISAYLLDADKTYRVTMRIGARTDTADADGQIVEETSVNRIERDVLESALERLRGEIMQIPPMYSALKKDGRRLYELARAGEVVERDPRPVTIYDLRVDSWDAAEPVLVVRCSKGTYIRTLVEDIAAAAGTLAHVAVLRRLSVSPFAESGLVTLGELESVAESDEGALDALLRPIDEAISDWPEVSLNAEQVFYLLRGNPVQVQIPDAPGLIRLYDENRRFLGLGEGLDDGRLAPRRLFVECGGEAG
jgi:tRNA pseudouridine55 synthase